MHPSDRTLYEFFADYEKARGEDRFLFDEEISYTVSQAFGIAKSLAEQLRAAGIEKGTRVAVRTTGSVKTVLLFYALQFLGGIAELHDPREWKEHPISICDGILSVGGRTVPLTFEPQSGEIKFEPDSRCCTVIVLTSGSTGAKKKVRLSQYNFISNSLDTQPIGGYFEDDVNLLIVPLCHVFALALIVTAVVTRHSVFLPQNTECEHVLDCMERYGVTRMNGVTGTYLALAQKKGERRLRLRYGFIGGGPCSKEQFFQIESGLKITLIPVYGMSECVGISCGDYRDSAEKRYGSVGKVYSMNEVRIAEDGEILVRGPAMAQGYEDGDTTDEDGFLHTGDLGYSDAEGYLHINGRKKEIIIRNGNNLSSAEIERKILTLPQVKDVCVVGVEDKKCGEVPCALLVAEETVDLCTVLNKLELPARIEYADHIPLTASGKHDKQRIRRFFEGHDGLSDCDPEEK